LLLPPEDTVVEVVVAEALEVEAVLVVAVPVNPLGQLLEPFEKVPFSLEYWHSPAVA